LKRCAENDASAEIAIKVFQRRFQKSKAVGSENEASSYDLRLTDERTGKQENTVLIKTSSTTYAPRRTHVKLAAGAVAIQAAIYSTGFNPALADSENPSAPPPSATLAPVDYNFVAQANLGAPFQIDSGRVAERTGTTAAIRDYAHLMVVTHIPVVDALNKILRQKNIEAPQNALLQGAYSTMVASLNAEHGAALDRDYIQGQLDYQKGNAALFRNEIQNGGDPDLKAFARATLPKIEDHLGRALTLARNAGLGSPSAK
jgi:putative membrane protein